MIFRDIFGAEEAGIRRYSNDDKPKRAEIAPFERFRITLVTLSVGDADNIDRFDVYRIHETLCAEDFLHLDLDCKTENVLQKIERLKQWEALTFSTKTADGMWRQRISYYLSFYEKLLSQLNNSRKIIIG